MGHFPRVGFARRIKDRPYNFTVRLLAVPFTSSLTLVWSLIHRDGVDAVMVVAFLAVPFACLLRDRPQPSGLDVLCVLAAPLGVIGFALDLFWWVKPDDAWAHASATFSVGLAFFVLCRETLPQRPFGASVVCMRR